LPKLPLNSLGSSADPFYLNGSALQPLCAGLEITRLDRDRAFIAAFGTTEVQHTGPPEDKTVLLPRVACRPRIVCSAPSFVARETPRGTTLGEKCETNAHKSDGEMRTFPDLHNPFSSGGALLLTMELFCYRRTVCNAMRAELRGILFKKCGRVTRK